MRSWAGISVENVRLRGAARIVDGRIVRPGGVKRRRLVAEPAVLTGHCIGIGQGRLVWMQCPTHARRENLAAERLPQDLEIDAALLSAIL